MGERYCTYCLAKRPKEKFVAVRDRFSGRIINYKCEECLSFSKLSVSERDKRGEEVRKRRKTLKLGRVKMKQRKDTDEE